MKYIIKNCDILRNTAEITIKGFEEKEKDVCLANHKKCQDCSDCIIKKIVEKCRYQLNKPNEHPFVLGAKDLAKNILSDLEIEEVNE